MLKPARQRGFTLIELMIGIAVMAILLLLGMPAYQAWIQNTQLRLAAESLAAGLRVARAEALQRNTNVEFVLTADQPIAANVNAITPSAIGRSWIVRFDTDPDPLVATYAFIQGKSGSEGSANAVITPVDATITFTSVGRTTLLAPSTFQVTNPAGGTCAGVGGPMRCLNVVVSVGGQVKMCDPSVVAAGDTRAC